MGVETHIPYLTLVRTAIISSTEFEKTFARLATSVASGVASGKCQECIVMLKSIVKVAILASYQDFHAY